MQENQHWYNQELVGHKGSVILTAWKAERESARIKNSAVIQSSDPAMIELFGGRPASSGFAVTDNSALRVSAVAACIQLIGGTIASLPLPVYERTKTGRVKIDSPLWWLLNEQPCNSWTAASMIEWWVRCNALRGDAFAKIIRNRAGVITGLLPLHPDRVRVETDGLGDIKYYYQPRTGGAYGIYADDILHIPGFGYDGDTGRSMSVIQHAAFQSIGIALAADDFSGKFYANGATPKHVIKAAGKMDQTQTDQLRAEYVNKAAGSGNAGKPLILTQGLEITEMSMSAVDAELLESRKYQVIDIARAFGVPPFMIGANDTTTSWGTGIEQMTLGFVKFTLQTYLNRIEQEINRKFFRTEKYFVEFNLDGLLRGDAKSEAEFLRQMIGGSQGPGWATTNEVRRVKNMPPIEGGDTIYEPKGTENAKAPATTTA